MRRVAAHWLYMPGRKRIHLPVVEIDENNVVNYYPIENELPVTEWLGGTFVVSPLVTSDFSTCTSLRDAITKLCGDNELYYPLYCWYTSLLDLDEPLPDPSSFFSLLHEHN